MIKLKQFLTTCKEDYEVDTTDTIYDIVFNIDVSSYRTEMLSITSFEAFIKAFYDKLEITEIRGNNYYCPLMIDYTKLVKDNIEVFGEYEDINYYIEENENGQREKLNEDDYIYSWVCLLKDANDGNTGAYINRQLIKLLKKCK